MGRYPRGALALNGKYGGSSTGVENRAVIRMKLGRRGRHTTSQPEEVHTGGPHELRRGGEGDGSSDRPTPET